MSRTETSLVVVPPSPGKALCVDITVTNPLGTSATSTADAFAFGSSGSCNGYRFVASDGGIFDFGSAAFEGSTGGTALQAPIVGMATTPDGNGYWLVASDGGIFTFGDAAFYGSTGAHAPQPAHRGHGGHPRRRRATGWWRPTAASSASATPASSARRARMHLNQPIVGMAATPDGQGYWLVASDGGIFTFGTPPTSARRARRTSTSPSWAWRPRRTGAATGWWPPTAGSSPSATPPIYGSTGAHRTSTSPSWAWRPPRTAQGYWLVAADGGIFTFGDAPFFGSTGGSRLEQTDRGHGGRLRAVG